MVELHWQQGDYLAMKNLVLTLSLVSGLCMTASCKKEDSGKVSASGELNSSEKGLLAHLPGDGQVVFGGRYGKFMDYWKNSPLKGLASDLMKMTGQKSDMSDYMNCWMEEGGEKMTIAGTLNMQGQGVEMRMVFGGLKKELFIKCAGKGGMASKVDEDGKYLELQNVPNGMGGTYNIGYYFINDETTLFAMTMSVLGSAPKTANRAELEAALKSVESASAASNSELAALAKTADRSKAFWFAGSAKGTPLADKIKGGTAWIDADSTSLSMGFSIQVTDSEMPKTAVDGYNKAKGDLGKMVPPGFKKPLETFLKDVHLSADGETLNGRFKLTNEVLDEVVPQAKGMLKMLF